MGGVEVKAAVLLSEGRVAVRRVGPGWVRARVVGDTSSHQVTWDDVAGWACDCLAFAFRRRCSHQAAVARVVVLTVRDDVARARGCVEGSS